MLDRVKVWASNCGIWVKARVAKSPRRMSAADIASAVITARKMIGGATAVSAVAINPVGAVANIDPVELLSQLQGQLLDLEDNAAACEAYQEVFW